nr:Putative pyruvate formate lyase-activating enzyme [Methylocystis sp. SC2]
MHDVSATPRATLTRAREIARKAGLRHVYTGNVHDEAGQSTYCHVCGARVIGRDWYEITSWALNDNGCCRSCGARCASVLEESHGSWGARRTPIEFGVEGSPARSSAPNL